METNITNKELNNQTIDTKGGLKTVLRKKQMVLILVALIIVGVLAAIFFLSQSQQQQLVGQTQTNPKLKYTKPDQSFNYQRLIDPIPLSVKELSQKNRIVQNLRSIRNLPPEADVEGVIFENLNVRIGYVSGPDDFEAEILTKDFLLAKQQTEKFFTDQGFSKEAICKGIRLFYYVNADLQNTLPQGTPFDPNPLSCQVIPTPIP